MVDISCWQSKFLACDYSDRLLKKLAQLNEKVSQPVDIAEITKAIYYAKKYHCGQMRESGEPYYSHPIEVAYMLAEHTALKIAKYYQTDLIVTALLHDVIEDTELTKEKIADIFDDQIAQQVDDLTRVKGDREISAAETINSLFLQEKHGILIIKLFDRMHNLQTLSVKSPEKVRKIVKETLTSFLALSAYLNALDIEKQIVKFCALASSANQYKQRNFSFLDNRQPFAPTFQNVLNQIYTL